MARKTGIIVGVAAAVAVGAGLMFAKQAEAKEEDAVSNELQTRYEQAMAYPASMSEDQFTTLISDLEKAGYAQESLDVYGKYLETHHPELLASDVVHQMQTVYSESELYPDLDVSSLAEREAQLAMVDQDEPGYVW